jgi:hypothetical protein
MGRSVTLEPEDARTVRRSKSAIRRRDLEIGRQVALVRSELEVLEPPVGVDVVIGQPGERRSVGLGDRALRVRTEERVLVAS